MLITDIQHEMPALPFMWSPEARRWRAVSLASRQPYFLVSYSNRELDARLFQTSIISGEEDLLSFCSDVKGNATREIHQVAVFLPDPENGVGSWRMLYVKEVWSGIDDTDGTITAVFVGVDGQVCSGSLFISDVNRVKLVDLRYQLDSGIGRRN